MIDIHPFKKWSVLRRMPVKLADPVGVGAHGQGGKLGIRHDRDTGVGIVGHAGDILALVQRGHTAGVMGNDHVRICLLLHDLNLAQRGKRARKIARDKNVAEAKAAAIEPG